MKKVLFVVLVFAFNISFIYASSINDLYNRLYELEEAKELYFGMSFDNIYEVEKKIDEIDLLIDSLYNKVNEINNEIDNYQKEILEINEQVKYIMTFYQVMDNDNGYLEYLIDSENYVDLVYRKTAVKQIISYYDQLVFLINNKMKKLDDDLKKVDDEILKIQEEREKYKRLELVIKGSGNSYGSFETSIDDDINSLLEEINLYKSLGCNNNESLSFCLSIYNDSDLTYPLQRGCVSKDYMALEHKGIDLACNKEGNNVYSAGNGIVSRIVRESTCGGNIIFIYHNVKGKEYTTIYAHLFSINVHVGQVVNKDTIIGFVGGDSTAYINGGYDKCSNGAHLHYGISYGHHAYDYNIYLFNPRFLNNYPNVLSGYFNR